METIYLSQSDFLPSERMRVEARESVLYRRDGIVYKYLIPSCREGRKEIITLIDEDQLVNTTKPLKLIDDPYTEEFVGYSMEDLIGYINLKEYLLSDCLNHDYQTRRKAALELITCLRCFRSKGYIHHDLSRRNIMIGEGEGRIGDIDCMSNPGRGITRYNLFQSDVFMETCIMDAVGCIILKHAPYNKGIKEKYNDKILSALIASNSFYAVSDLYENGYRAEDIYHHLDETAVEKYKSLLKH